MCLLNATVSYIWFSMGFNYFQRVPVNKVELGNWKVINHH